MRRLLMKWGKSRQAFVLKVVKKSFKAECWYGWCNTWTGPQCVCKYKYGELRRLHNPSVRRRGNKCCKVLCSKKLEKNHPMVPPLDHFQGKNKNRSSPARMISALRRAFFANLITFEQQSGLKNLSLLKIAILKMGLLSKFQSHRSWGDAHISLGAAQAPPN